MPVRTIAAFGQILRRIHVVRHTNWPSCIHRLGTTGLCITADVADGRVLRGSAFTVVREVRTSFRYFTRPTCLIAFLMAAHPSIYRPLDQTKREIRLLRLIDADGDDVNDLHFELGEFSLNDDLEFTALSYRWGDEVAESTMRVNDIECPPMGAGQIRLLANLHEYLKHGVVGALGNFSLSAPQKMETFRVWTEMRNRRSLALRGESTYRL